MEAFKKDLRDAVPHDELKALHRRSGARHLAYAARQFAIIAACSWALWQLSNPLLWVPLADPAGLHVLQHDDAAARGGPPRGLRQAAAARRARCSGCSTRSTSGISASQFTRWHLDHHDNLGSWEDDPKRRWLSPKRNARWFKLLYCTPALMPDLLPRRRQRVALVSARPAADDPGRAPRHGGAPARCGRRAVRRSAAGGCCCACGRSRTSSSSQSPSPSTGWGSTTTSTPHTRSSGRP